MYEADADLRYEDDVQPHEAEVGGQVRPALDLLGLQIEKAHALLSHLEERLDGLLLPHDDMNKPAEPEPPRRASSRLTDDLRAHYGAVRGLLGRLSSLHDRIDL